MSSSTDKSEKTTTTTSKDERKLITDIILPFSMIFLVDMEKSHGFWPFDQSHPYSSDLRNKIILGLRQLGAKAKQVDQFRVILQTLKDDGGLTRYHKEKNVKNRTHKKKLLPFDQSQSVTSSSSSSSTTVPLSLLKINDIETTGDVEMKDTEPEVSSSSSSSSSSNKNLNALSSKERGSSSSGSDQAQLERFLESIFKLPAIVKMTEGLGKIPLAKLKKIKVTWSGECLSRIYDIFFSWTARRSVPNYYFYTSTVRSHIETATKTLNQLIMQDKEDGNYTYPDILAIKQGGVQLESILEFIRTRKLLSVYKRAYSSTLNGYFNFCPVLEPRSSKFASGLHRGISTQQQQQQAEASSSLEKKTRNSKGIDYWSGLFRLDIILSESFFERQMQQDPRYITWNEGLIEKSRALIKNLTIKMQKQNANPNTEQDLAQISEQLNECILYYTDHETNRIVTVLNEELPKKEPDFKRITKARQLGFIVKYTPDFLSTFFSLVRFRAFHNHPLQQMTMVHPEITFDIELLSWAKSNQYKINQTFIPKKSRNLDMFIQSILLLFYLTTINQKYEVDEVIMTCQQLQPQKDRRLSLDIPGNFHQQVKQFLDEVILSPKNGLLRKLKDSPDSKWRIRLFYKDMGTFDSPISKIFRNVFYHIIFYDKDLQDKINLIESLAKTIPMFLTKIHKHTIKDMRPGSGRETSRWTVQNLSSAHDDLWSERTSNVIKQFDAVYHRPPSWLDPLIYSATKLWWLAPLIYSPDSNYKNNTTLGLELRQIAIDTAFGLVGL